MNVWRWSNAEMFGSLQFGMSFRETGELKDIPRQAFTPAGRVFLRSVGISPSQCVLAPLEQGVTVLSVSALDAGRSIPLCDGLVTTSSGLGVTVTVSDCFAVVLFDPVSSWLSVLHAGWRGVHGRIVSRACEMKEAFDGRLDRVVAWIGPGIQRCHFEVQGEVASRFPMDVYRHQDRIYVDLRDALIRQLQERGIRSLYFDDRCTACDASTFFSYRRDKPPRPQTMLAYACIR